MMLLDVFGDMRRLREGLIEDDLEVSLQSFLNAERGRGWPSDAQHVRIKQDFRRFAEWARRSGVGVLPASAYSVARYLIEMAQHGASREVFERTANAVLFVHYAAEQFIDHAPILAALAYLDGKQEAKTTRH
jgi:hypothetical protein